jgi:hypothetical protein
VIVQAVIVQALFHPRKMLNQTAKPMKYDTLFQGMKQQKTCNRCSRFKLAQTDSAEHNDI